MAKHICTNCGIENDTDAKFCKACGSTILENPGAPSNEQMNIPVKKKKRRWIISIVIIVIALIAIFVIISSGPKVASIP